MTDPTAVPQEPVTIDRLDRVGDFGHADAVEALAGCDRSACAVRWTDVESGEIERLAEGRHGFAARPQIDTQPLHMASSLLPWRAA